MSESDYPEKWRRLDEAVNRQAKIFQCIDPYMREVIGVDEEMLLSYSEGCVVMKQSRRPGLRGVYEFSVLITVKEIDG
jgi:hypothetical protein